MSLRSFLNPLKDQALEAAVKLWFNRTRQSIGTLTRIKIDTHHRVIEADFDLRGEASPTTVWIRNYTLSSTADETTIELTDLETSKPWINAILAEHLPVSKRRFPIPSTLKALL